MELQYYVRARSLAGVEPEKPSGFRLIYAYIKCDQGEKPTENFVTMLYYGLRKSSMPPEHELTFGMSIKVSDSHNSLSGLVDMYSLNHHT